MWPFKRKSKSSESSSAFLESLKVPGDEMAQLFQRAAQEIEGENAIEQIAEVAGEFVAISSTIAGDLIGQDDNAMGCLGFASGVVDAMCYKVGLDVGDTRKVLKRYLSHVHKGDIQRVEDTLAAIAQIATDKTWAHSIGIGGNAALQLVQNDSGYRPVAFFALSKMLSGEKLSGA